MFSYAKMIFKKQINIFSFSKNENLQVQQTPQSLSMLSITQNLFWPDLIFMT